MFKTIALIGFAAALALPSAAALAGKARHRLTAAWAGAANSYPVAHAEGPGLELATIRPSTRPKRAANGSANTGRVRFPSSDETGDSCRVIPPLLAARRRSRRARRGAAGRRPTDGRGSVRKSRSSVRHSARPPTSPRRRWASGGRRGDAAGRRRSGLRPPPGRASRRGRDDPSRRPG